MDEVDIQIKVLKENNPILFTWWNKETKTVEGCIVTCHCQDFGIYYSSYAKSVKGRKSKDCFEVFSSDGTVKFAEALEKAEILTLPKETDCESILGKKVRTKQICDSPVSGFHERNRNSKKGEEDETGDVRIALEESVDCNVEFESITPTKKDEVQLEKKHDRDIKEKDVITVHTRKGPEQENYCCRENANTRTVVDKGSLEYQKYGIGGASVLSALSLEDEKDGNKSEKMLDLQDGEEECDREIKKINDIESCNQRTEGSHQVVENSVENVEENTAPILPVNHGVTDIEGSAASVGQVIDVSTLSADSVVVLDESKGGVSEVDRALYEALKGIIEVSEANVSEQSSWQQTSRPSQDLPKKSSELDLESLSEPVNPVVVINTPAMIKYREHKNEEYLKRLHQLRTMKKVVTIICEICGALRTNKSFANHMSAFHSKEERERNFSCEICGKKFLRPENLQRHLLTHTDCRAYCSYCDKSFKHEYSRKAHEKIHWEKPPPPPVRKPRYKTLNPKIRRKPGEIDEEYRNVKSQKSKGPFKQEGPKDPRSKTVACSTCGKVVSRKSIRRHMRNHYRKPDSDDSVKATSKSLNVACELCGKVLRERNLKLHMNTVHNPRLVKCEICGKMVRNGSMYGHAKLHTEEKPHVCSYCSATFHFKSSLHAHLRKHTKERPIQCRFCDHTFSRYETRLNHERRHTGERPYKCNLCQKDWKDRGAYKQHMLKYHPGVPMMFKRGPYAPQNQGILVQTESTTE